MNNKVLDCCNIKKLLKFYYLLVDIYKNLDINFYFKGLNNEKTISFSDFWRW